ncbi:MAG: hypothetical protein KBT34_07845 [Prevotella sp.]|nr:hypothetical protein [Candidatus Prevotella equi]
MTNEEYITLNKDKDPRSLALKKAPENVDILWCLRQIEGYQLAKKKLPRWALTEGLWYPPRLSMEQCSSESTAQYKRDLIQRLYKDTFIAPFERYDITDITGGFGVDFSYMAQGADIATYIERQEVLCEAARHNMPLLGIPHATIIKEEFSSNSSLSYFQSNAIRHSGKAHFVFADPARRDDKGNKIVAIEDCTPNIAQLQESILQHADLLIVKLSPMLDITQALRSLKNVIEVHVISVKGECKELLFVLAAPYIYNKVEEITYHCANLQTSEESFSCTLSYNDKAKDSILFANPHKGMILFEPNASILKTGVQEAFATRYNLQKLHPMSNLYIGKEQITKIPARQFVITDVCDFSKTSLRQLHKDTKQANLTIRNFPSTVAELRKRLKIKEGGSIYLFATTLYDGSHALIKCQKDLP